MSKTKDIVFHCCFIGGSGHPKYYRKSYTCTDTIGKKERTVKLFEKWLLKKKKEFSVEFDVPSSFITIESLNCQEFKN